MDGYLSMMIMVLLRINNSNFSPYLSLIDAPHPAQVLSLAVVVVVVLVVVEVVVMVGESLDEMRSFNMMIGMEC